jgi:hypothetical protein
MSWLFSRRTGEGKSRTCIVILCCRKISVLMLDHTTPSAFTYIAITNTVCMCGKLLLL